MIRSDAVPLQFWQVDCDTYNEEERFGQDNRCFCGMWNCDDTITDQFQDDAGIDYTLLVYDDEDDSLIDEIPYEETSSGVYQLSFIPSDNTPGFCDQKVYFKIRQNAQIEPVAQTPPDLTTFLTTEGTPPTLDALVNWINSPGGSPFPGLWTLSSTPDTSVNGSGGTEGYVCGGIAALAGFDYEFDVQFEWLVTGGVNPLDTDVIFALLDSSFNELDTVTFNYTSYGVKTPNFTLNPGGTDAAYLGMRITNNTAFDTKTYELQAASYTPGPVSYEWTLGAAPTVNLPGTVGDPKESELLYGDYTFVNGLEYTVNINYTRTVNSGSSNPRTSTLYILNGSNVTQFSNNEAAEAGANTLSVTFIANANTTRIGFRHNSGSDVDITVNSIAVTLMQETGVTQVVQRSDCYYIKTAHDGSVLLEYSNARNYAGEINNNGSPEILYYLRIPAVFNEERFPETVEPLQLSNNRIISLNSQVKAQKLLETDQLPNYMRRKLKLVLKHQFLTIEDKDYVQEEELEQLENTNKRWPMRRMTCWLTEKEYVIRNIL